MQLVYKNYLKGALGMLRFQFIRLFFFRRLQASGLSYVGNKVSFFIQGKGKMILKGKVSLNDYSRIHSTSHLEIGKNFYMNKFACVIAFDSITIGDNVSIGQFTTILDHDHAYQKNEEGNIHFEGYHTSPVTIGNNVWIANHCSILRGVNIGNNVIVGANTLVHKDVPDNCVVMGVPYKIVKKI